MRLTSSVLNRIGLPIKGLCVEGCKVHPVASGELGYAMTDLHLMAAMISPSGAAELVHANEVGPPR